MYDMPEPYDDPFLAPLDDAAANEADLDAILDPWLPVPDQRVLQQTRWTPLPNGEREDLTTSAATHPMAYICYLQLDAQRLHQMAADWEAATTSTAVRILNWQLGIRPIAQIHPLIWLESTPLMRHLRRWQYEAENPDAPRRPSLRRSKSRYDNPVDPFSLP